MIRIISVTDPSVVCLSNIALLTLLNQERQSRGMEWSPKGYLQGLGIGSHMLQVKASAVDLYLNPKPQRLGTLNPS